VWISLWPRPLGRRTWRQISALIFPSGEMTQSSHYVSHNYSFHDPLWHIIENGGDKKWSGFSVLPNNNSYIGIMSFLGEMAGRGTCRTPYISRIRASAEKMSRSWNSARLNPVGSGRTRNDENHHGNASYRWLEKGEYSRQLKDRPYYPLSRC
jgi:hypothetical protein